MIAYIRQNENSTVHWRCGFSVVRPNLSPASLLILRQTFCAHPFKSSSCFNSNMSHCVTFIFQFQNPCGNYDLLRLTYEIWTSCLWDSNKWDSIYSLTIYRKIISTRRSNQSNLPSRRQVNGQYYYLRLDEYISS